MISTGHYFPNSCAIETWWRRNSDARSKTAPTLDCYPDDNKKCAIKGQHKHAHQTKPSLTYIR